MMKWLCQLLLALDYLQTMKVLHRDIKTSNLLLTCDMDVQLGTAAQQDIMNRHSNSTVSRHHCLSAHLQVVLFAAVDSEQGMHCGCTG
jgi:serine/threonine protein kinase